MKLALRVLTRSSARGTCRRISLLAVWILIPHASWSAPEPERALTQYRLRVWQEKDGLPLDTVYHLAQGPDGYLWVGTEDGLARFDGVRFTTFDRTNDPRLRSNVFSLAVDDAGTLWIGTEEPGLVGYRRGEFFDVDEVGWPPHAVDVLLPGDGGLWIGSRGGGLLRLDEGELTVYGSEAGLASPVITALAPRSSGGLWVGTADGLQRFDGERFHDAGGSELEDVTIAALSEDRLGVLWVGAREGLFRLEGESIRRFGVADGLPIPFVGTLHQDTRGDLWLGTRGGGLGRLSGGRFEWLTEEDGLPLGIVEDILQDRDGSVWVATMGGGIVQLSEGAALPLTPREGLPDAPILPILQARDGTIWLGTFGAGVVERSPDGRLTVLDTSRGLSHDMVLSLAEDERGALWVGTREGLNRVYEGEVTAFRQNDGLPHPTISALFPQRDRLWVGTLSGLAVVEEGLLRTLFGREEMPHQVVAFAKGRRGSLWLATKGGGLAELSDGRLEWTTTAHGLPSNVVLSLHEDRKGSLWIGTAGGLSRFEDGRFATVTEEHGLPDERIFAMLEDGLGSFWASSNRGVFRIPAERLSAVADGREDSLDLEHFTEADGMPKTECNGGFQPAAWRAADGRLWFPTSRGAAIFDPQRADERQKRLEPSIETVEVDGSLVPPDPGVELDPGPKRVQIRYTAVNLLAPEDLEFQYRLEGFEDSWFAAGNSRVASYPRLPPGHFTFLVRSRQPPGAWSPPASVAITVPRRFYQTIWFVGLCVLFAGLVAGTVTRVVWRRRIERRERLWQAQKLETIGSLAGGIAHDFNNLLTGILGYSELALEELGAKHPVRPDIEEIHKTAERAASLTRQLLALGSHQMSEPRWVSPNRLVIELTGLLRRLIPESIEIETSLDPEVGSCLIDPVQLEQVILNLALNSRDAMPSGGTVTIETRQVDGRVLARRLTGIDSGSEYVALTVRDTGTGMDTATMERLFEPFFTTKERGQGTGLGLSVVYGIVRQSGGAIDVESEPVTGTAFHVYLPSDPTAVPDEPASPPRGEAATGEGLVLVVEDDPSVLRLVARVLEQAGFDVTSASDGQEGLERWQQRRGDLSLIVTDAVMPGLGGIELAKAVWIESPSLPVLFLSGYTEESPAALYPGDAPASFLGKPFSAPELLSRIDELLRGGEPPADPS